MITKDEITMFFALFFEGNANIHLVMNSFDGWLSKV